VYKILWCTGQVPAGSRTDLALRHKALEYTSDTTPKPCLGRLPRNAREAGHHLGLSARRRPPPPGLGFRVSFRVSGLGSRACAEEEHTKRGRSHTVSLASARSIRQSRPHLSSQHRAHELTSRT
jgi:hypothetical protein